MKRFAAAIVASLLLSAPALAAETTQSFQADLANKSAQLETLRARSAMNPAATTSATLIEADNLLRQLREASPDRRPALRSQLEAALVRLELEIDAAVRAK